MLYNGYLKNLKEDINDDKQTFAITGASGGLIAGLGITSILTAKRTLYILKNDPKKSMEMYKEACKTMNKKYSFDEWKREMIKSTKSFIRFGITTTALGSGIGCFSAYKYNKLKKKGIK